MDYMLTSHSHMHVDKEQQLHHAQSWPHSSSEAMLAAGTRKLMAALHESHSLSPAGCSFDEADFLAPKMPSSESNLPLPHRHVENSAPRPHRGESPQPDDVVLLVGKSRLKFFLHAETLISGSAYFKHLLQHSHPPPSLAGGHARGFTRPPIVIDCEESIFEGLLLLMRYGTLEALPPMSAAEIFRLRKEAKFYGVHYMEPPPKSRAATESGDECSDMSSVRSRSSSPSGSPKSMTSMSSSEADNAYTCRNTQSGRHHEGVRLACSTQRRLSELPEFPPELADPAKLVLASCSDKEKASIYTCECGSRQWALNFHHRHAFCTSCGNPLNVSPKHFAEMFVAVAAHYSSEQSAPVELNRAWSVSSDSTCMLRFISSAGNGPDACSCSGSQAGPVKEAPPTIWAANCVYSHAFCTCCGKGAKGPVLLSLILALRYGGTNKASKCSTRSNFRLPTENVL